MAAFRVSRRLAHEGTTWILGSGDLAARAALAIRMTYPGFTAKRLFLQRTTVYVAQRVPGEPVNEADVATAVVGGGAKPHPLAASRQLASHARTQDGHAR